MTKRQLFFGVLATIAACGWIFLQMNERPMKTTASGFIRPSQPVVDLMRFEQIKTGMTLEQVRDAIGSTGTLQSRVELSGIVSESYVWQNPGGSNAIVQFQDGKVIAKAQALLR